MSHVKTKDEKVVVLQHNVFLLITRAHTNSRQEPYHSPTNARKGRASSIRDRSHIFCAGTPHATKTTLRPISLARFKTALGTTFVKDSHPFFCVRVGFVGGGSVASIEPKGAGFGEGRKVSE